MNFRFSLRSSGMVLPCLLLCAFVLGCGGSDGPELGYVTGTLKVNGEAIEGATITFSPQEGRHSVGYTDDSGYYKLQYTSDRNGALPGEHTVTITTYRDAQGGEGEGEAVEARPEMLPAEYNTESTLKKTVESGSQTIDFDLTTDGKPIKASNKPRE